MSNTVIDAYSLEHASSDGVLVKVFENRWTRLTGGKPIVATEAIYKAFTLAALQEIWNGYVDWRHFVQPYLPQEEDVFETMMHDKRVWVMEDPEAFTIMFPDDY